MQEEQEEQEQEEQEQEEKEEEEEKKETPTFERLPAGESSGVWKMQLSPSCNSCQRRFVTAAAVSFSAGDNSLLRLLHLQTPPAPSLNHQINLCHHH